MTRTPFSVFCTTSRLHRRLDAFLLISAWCGWLCIATALVRAQAPEPVDPRVRVTEFARQPDIVTPTGIAVDRRGRVFVIESHTHFRPNDYSGPATDLVVILADRDADGRADDRTVFAEGFRYGMDLAFHPDGTLYLATRWSIYRLPDSNGDNRADRLERIVHLDTPGDYPHNGLSGLAFDPLGNLQFGLGENLGEPYRLIGSDGRVYVGGGEGGSTYWCLADGSELRRVSTGWWNPFGLACDTFGRTFGTDNDPGASPPCRFIEVIDGGDYGYEYRYGRSGLNPLITWQGELPGTLTMRSGTAEAPCGIVAYEAGMLPNEYQGDLLVPAWADHKIERFSVRTVPDAGQSRVVRSTWIQGDNDFRPVDIAVAPDGSLYVTDWVLASYTLHGHGKIWRITCDVPTQQSAKKIGRKSEFIDGLRSRSRLVREVVASTLVKSESGQRELLEVLRGANDPYAKATAMWFLSKVAKKTLRDELQAALQRIVAGTEPLELRVLAARILGSRWQCHRPLDLPLPLLIQWLHSHGKLLDRDQVDTLLKTPDPAVLHAVIQVLADPSIGRKFEAELGEEHLWAFLLAARRGWQLSAEQRDRWIEKGLQAEDRRARLLAIKWIADEELAQFAVAVKQLLQVDDLDYRSFRAIFVCEQRLAEEEVSDWPTQAQLRKALQEPLSPAARRWAVQLAMRIGMPLPLDELEAEVYRSAESDEYVWAIARHPSDRRFEKLAKIAADPNLPVDVRCVAVVGLADRPEEYSEQLLRLLEENQQDLSIEVLRALAGVKLTGEKRKSLETLQDGQPHLAPYVMRAISGNAPDKPPPDETRAWLAMLQQSPGVPKRGERLFFHPKFGTCAKCHSLNGRGVDVGPSMSAISRRIDALGRQEGTRWLLQALLTPSAEMAPQYTPWKILTKDGKVLTGLPRRKGGTAEAYLGLDGQEFVVRKEDIERHEESRVSLMPENLLAPLTPQEIRDLFAFLYETSKLATD